MPSIAVSGVGSGLDINDLVKQLVAAEREPTEKRLNGREAEFQAKLSGFGVLKGALAEFQDTLQALKDPAAFQTRKASSSDESLLTANASREALPGSYRVEVARLAQHHKLVSEGFAGGDAEVGTGTLTLAVGERSFEVAIGEGQNTLAAIQKAINDAPGNTGVTASLIRVDGAEGEPVAKLMLTADDTGNANKISVAVADDDGDSGDAQGLSRLAFDPDGVQHLSPVQQPPNDDLDAELSIDGQTVTSASNRVSGVIPGVEINLLAAAKDSPQQLVIGLDSEGIRQAIDTFVTKYNGLVETFAQLASYDATTGETGTLFADATLRGLTSQLRRGLSDTVGSLTGGQNSLAAIGITSDRSGQLTVDEARLNASLESGFAELGKLFAGADGIAVRLDTVLTGYLGTSGALSSRIDGLNTRIADLNSQRGTLDQRMEALEARLLAQFSAMDALVSQLTSTGDYLTQQFNALEAMLGRRR